MYNAAGIANFQASPPKISSLSSVKDHCLFERSLSIITTAAEMISLKSSARKTAVDVKYRAPFMIGIIRE